MWDVLGAPSCPSTAVQVRTRTIRSPPNGRGPGLGPPTAPRDGGSPRAAAAAWRRRPRSVHDRVETVEDRWPLQLVDNPVVADATGGHSRSCPEGPVRITQQPRSTSRRQRGRKGLSGHYCVRVDAGRGGASREPGTRSRVARAPPVRVGSGGSGPDPAHPAHRARAWIGAGWPRRPGRRPGHHPVLAAARLARGIGARGMPVGWCSVVWRASRWHVSRAACTCTRVCRRSRSSSRRC